MAIVLALVFRSRLRLLPLAVALAAVAITFGADALLGASLTMASIAVLPVLLGLGRRLRDPVPGAGARRSGGDARGAARGSRCRRSPPRRWRPASGSSCCCCRRCRWCAASALLLVVGIAIALVARADRRHGGAGARPRGRAAARGALAPRCAAPASWSSAGGARRGALRAAAAARRRARGAAALRGASAPAAGARWSRSCSPRPGWRSTRRRGRSPTSSELVPQDLPALQDLEALQRATGVAGEIDVVVEGRAT